MVAEAVSGMVQGVEGELVRIQADISNGLPVFNMIGYLSGEVKEAKERVRTALKNTGIVLPARRISVNFAPADLRKYGTFFDLGIAVSLLAAMQIIPAECMRDTIFIGELSLDGTLRPVSGVLPVIMEGDRKGYRKCVLPKGNEAEALFADRTEVYGFQTLGEVYDCLRNGTLDSHMARTGEGGQIVGTAEEEPSHEMRTEVEPGNDFSDIRGQRAAKRAMEIAAAGYHNLFLDGPPGVGKSMLASCMPGIMPDMTKEEMIDTTMIYSVKGLLKKGFFPIQKRPFRAPSHAVTIAGMFGGGNIPRPGEISLSHHGVLFLDELPEYSRELIEMFRIPMESHCIRLVRKERTLTFPADFLLVAAANPCPCGYYPNPDKCRCSRGQIARYQSRISGPILDRMDLFVRCEEMSYDVLTGNIEEESSEAVRKRVSQAWLLQRERLQGEGVVFNSRLSTKAVEKYCQIDGEGRKFMQAAFTSFGLTGRSYFKILKVARTIADLEGASMIKNRHLEEALHFRSVR